MSNGPDERDNAPGEDENNAQHDFRCECGDLVGRYTNHEPVTWGGLVFCSSDCADVFGRGCRAKESGK